MGGKERQALSGFYPAYIRLAWQSVSSAELAIPEDRIPAEFVAFAEAERATDPAQRPLLHAARKAVHG